MRPRPELFGLDHLGKDSELTGAVRSDAFMSAEVGHAGNGLHRTFLQHAYRLEGGDLPYRHVWVQELGVARCDDDVGVGNEVESAAGADSVDRGDHRFCHAAMPGGKTQLGTLRLARTGRECLRISSQLDDIKPGLEGVAVAGVHDHRDVVVSIEFGPRLLEVDKHLRVDGIRGIWTIEDQPACRAVVADLDRHVGSSWRISNTLPSGSVSKAKAAPGLCGVTGVSTDAPASMAC